MALNEDITPQFILDAAIERLEHHDMPINALAAQVLKVDTDPNLSFGDNRTVWTWLLATREENVISESSLTRNLHIDLGGISVTAAFYGSTSMPHKEEYMSMLRLAENADMATFTTVRDGTQSDVIELGAAAMMIEGIKIGMLTMMPRNIQIPQSMANLPSRILRRSP